MIGKASIFLNAIYVTFSQKTPSATQRCDHADE